MSVKIDDDLKERLRRLAEAERRTPHWLVKDAIEQYVERHELRQKLRGEVDEALSDYDATGLHVTMEEMDDWLTRRIAGEDVAPPEWHR
ncbi:MAG: ribbon-helix-helix protein, CopG family [Myxococcales bacterium]|nr:ribbon-helix-helix protein, CopG family [Myxococcales bacterium]